MLADLDRRLALEGTLYDWVGLAWAQVESAPFVPGWHIGAVCETLEAVSANQISRLVINLPPGCTKSLLVNVLWPTWEWLRRPGTKFIYASFDQSLPGRRDGGKILNLLGSQWWKDRFSPLLESKVASAANFDVIGGGFRFSTSPGGRGTGRHGNIVVFDDPIKPKDAQGRRAAVTHEALAKVRDWYSGTMSTRRADPKTHREVCIMQRLHKDDLAGYLIDLGARKVCFPMRFEKDYADPLDKRTREGELLCPARYDEPAVKAIEQSMPEEVQAAQLQQRPHTKGGKHFRRVWWRFWGAGREPCLCDKCFDARKSVHDSGRDCVPLPEAGLDVLSWDMAFKGKQTSDFVAGGAWRAYGGCSYLRSIFNQRIGFADSKRAVLKMSVAFPASKILVEDAANGPAIEDELKSDLSGITLVKPQGGKEARASAVEPLFDTGTVFLPHPDICPLTWSLMHQAEAFPNDLNDDMVDMLTQALTWYRGQGAALARFDRAMTQALRDQR